jgi:hypothetical protein
MMSTATIASRSAQTVLSLARSLIVDAFEHVLANMVAHPTPSSWKVVENVNQEMDTAKKIARGPSVSVPKSADPIRIYDISDRYAARIYRAIVCHRLQGISTAC